MTTNESEIRLEAMKQKLAVMQWDLDRDQLNPAVKMKYEKLKEECERLTKEIKEHK